MEMKEKYGKTRSRWKNQRKDLFERAEIAIQEIDRRRRQGQRVEKDIMGRLRGV